MKTKFIKLLCMLMALAMLVVMVGCSQAEENNSSIPTSSVNSTVTSSQEETTEEETDEDICYFENGRYFILTTGTAREITDNLVNLEDELECDSEIFLKRLGLVKKLVIDDTDFVTAGDKKLFKTNIKYTDFEDKMLGYMSKKYFEASIFSNDKYLTQKDGYLYSANIKTAEYSEWVIDAFLEQEIDGKYKYIVTLEDNNDKYRYISVTIIKTDDIYVVDSYVNIDREKATFKGYDKLNDITANAIVNNFLGLEGASSGDICGLIDCFINYDWDFDKNKTYKTKDETLLKTNVKYKDFVDGALKYMSKKRFDDDLANHSCFVEKDGYLYSISLGATGYDYNVLDVVFEKEREGKYTYIAKYGIDEICCYTLGYYRVNIINENGIFVIDSIESPEDEEFSIKNYKALNDYIAEDIIENAINIKEELEIGRWANLNGLLPQSDRDDTTKTVKVGDTEFYDTEIKYADFETAVLPFMSERFLNSIKRNAFKEVNNNLYVADLDEWLYSVVVLEADLQNDSDGKYEYLAKCYSASHDIGCFCVKATIIKENGNYVLDEYEVVENK